MNMLFKLVCLSTICRLAIGTDAEDVRNTTDDSFRYKCSSINEKLNFSKREVFSSIAKLYDPMGWVQSLVTKIIMQNTWKRNLDYDDPLPSDLNEKWIECARNLKSIESIDIQRDGCGTLTAWKNVNCMTLRMPANWHTKPVCTNII